MFFDYARRLTGKTRTTQTNHELGLALAFVAGATNAGGFLAVRQYTSHMTGIVSAMADQFALGAYDLVLGSAGALLSFVAGAAISAIMINYARRRQLQSQFAFPLLLEALLLLAFGILGARLSEIDGLFVPATVMLLCFVMGSQNAMITKLSSAEIRTTHITGIVTDIGIELGKLLYRNLSTFPSEQKVMADRRRLSLLASIAMLFFLGGVAGALGFKYVGYISTVPLALVLIIIAGVPALDDILTFARRNRLALGKEKSSQRPTRRNP